VKIRNITSTITNSGLNKINRSYNIIISSTNNYQNIISNKYQWVNQIMKKYIEELITLIDYEREEETVTMVSEIKYLTPYERELIGHTITSLTGKKLSKEYGLTLVQYGRSKPIETKINISDRVIVSKSNPLQTLLVATVTDKGNKYIQLSFDKKVPRWALKEEVQIDLYVNDVTFKRMEDNLKELTKQSKDALSYHLQLKQPQENNTTIEVDYYDKSLNPSQKRAVEKSLTTNDFHLIHGPFGTGKTRTLTEIILQENRKGSKILVTAESNTAVDNLLKRMPITDNLLRLGQTKRISPENRKYSLESKILEHPSNNKLQGYYQVIDEYTEELNYYTKPTQQNSKGLTDNQIKKYAQKHKSIRGIDKNTIQSMARWIDYKEKIGQLYEKIHSLEDKIIPEVITENNIIFTTNSSAALEVIKDEKFDVAIIDEASQTTIPSNLIPISKARKFILAGDHKQLPPTIINSNARPLEKTLFESLIRKYPEKSELLDTQYRMNQQLMQFSNTEFYHDKLQTADKNRDITIKDLTDTIDEKAITFIDTSQMQNNTEKQLNDSTSYTNPLEKDLVIQVTQKYIQSGIKEDDIGIITPYTDQVTEISQETDIEVNSVDGFQGREKQVIIISTVRSNNRADIGFLSDMRRLNVALTRAKRKLVIIGNKNTLETNKTYKRLLKYATYN